ncbi:hypothetical protein Q8F55_002803 [Vanrija albida]|uniref:histone acetyltransferase n=1 Tax=Vanrija albida TaxID=181172 RepID=A0ABR3QAV0_9TREE
MASTSDAKSRAPSLRDTIASALNALPNAQQLGLTVVSSSPKRTTALFPHSPSAGVRCWEVEHLVVVHSALPDGSTPEPSPNVLAAAISAHVFTLPTAPGAPPTSLLYISKVDSSGYAPPGAPLTRELAVGVLRHFLAPATRPTPRVAATLFARSQGQYLFPNSVEGGGKRVLGGLGLCGWWKGVYEEGARRLVADGVPAADLDLRYLLPSYSAAEASGMLGAPRRPLPAGVSWRYAPPFVAQLLPESGVPSVATLVPSLPDDPKTRFLDELVAEAIDAVPIALTKPGKDKDGSEQRKRTAKEKDAAAEEEDRERAHAALAKIPPEEFWERLGFRQECVSGDVTGFFSATLDPSEGGAGEAAKAKEAKEKETKDGEKPDGTKRTLSQALVERLLKSMLNTDFATRALAAEGTAHWLASARSIVVDELGEEGWAASTATIAAKAGVDAPAAPPKRKEETVTMLQPRKKKK